MGEGAILTLQKDLDEAINTAMKEGVEPERIEMELQARAQDMCEVAVKRSDEADE